jgi:hypothetical protein
VSSAGWFNRFHFPAFDDAQIGELASLAALKL